MVKIFRVLLAVSFGLCLAVVGLASPPLVSAEIVTEQSKIIQTALDELEKCKRSAKDVKASSSDDLIKLRWRLEQEGKEKEELEHRTLFEILQVKATTWFDYFRRRYVSWSRAGAEKNVEFVRMETQKLAVEFGLHAFTMAAGIVSMGTDAKTELEKIFLVWLKRNLPREYVQYAERVTAVVFIGLPAFLLAVIWHKVTSSIQSVLASMFLGKRGSEAYKEREMNNMVDESDEDIRLGAEEDDDKEYDEEGSANSENEEDDEIEQNEEDE
jgi:hypothetical protein